MFISFNENSVKKSRISAPDGQPRKGNEKSQREKKESFIRRSFNSISLISLILILARSLFRSFLYFGSLSILILYSIQFYSNLILSLYFSIQSTFPSFLFLFL